MSRPSFNNVLYRFYEHHKRFLPWREREADGRFGMYKIVVSELMLQQTQVDRVIPKYNAFIEVFPDVKTLANAPFTKVIELWSGLGYNRRALYLHEWAKSSVNEGLAKNPTELTAHRGFGPNTASAVFVYAYNQPLLFIETNIRTVMLYHFFENQQMVNDKQIIDKLAERLDRQNPRQFYWALMDYGTYLKKSKKANNHQSNVYNKQSLFKGSQRELRGKILRLVQEKSTVSEDQILDVFNDDRVHQCVEALVRDGLLVRKNQQVSFPN